MKKYSENLIKELVTLFPKVKIPFYEEHMYYIDTLCKSETYAFLPGVINELVSLEQKLKTEQISITKYKLKTFDLIIEKWNTDKVIEKLNAVNPHELFPETKFKQKNFTNFKRGKTYISVDLSEANWQMLKRFAIPEINQDITWEQYLISLGIDPIIAKSKFFRQYVIGNTNPKKLHTLSCLVIQTILEKINSSNLDLNVVMVQPDELLTEENEILLEFEIIDKVKPLQKIQGLIKVLDKLIYKTKVQVFGVRIRRCVGDSIYIKDYFDKDTFQILNSELYAVEGKRFFIYHKLLMLNEQELDPRDLMFKQEKRIASWVI